MLQRNPGTEGDTVYGTGAWDHLLYCPVIYC